jgi:hypothetical protein
MCRVWALSPASLSPRAVAIVPRTLATSYCGFRGLRGGETASLEARKPLERPACSRALCAIPKQRSCVYVLPQHGALAPQAPLPSSVLYSGILHMPRCPRMVVLALGRCAGGYGACVRRGSGNKRAGGATCRCRSGLGIRSRRRWLTRGSASRAALLRRRAAPPTLCHSVSHMHTLRRLKMYRAR